MIDAKKDQQVIENRALKKQVKELEKELLHKDKALTETAALLVLKKNSRHF